MWWDSDKKEWTLKENKDVWKKGDKERLYWDICIIIVKHKYENYEAKIVVKERNKDRRKINISEEMEEAIHHTNIIF